MLPATWSNPGFGLYGKSYSKDWVFGYEVYLTNGFDEQIIDNEENKTFLPATKSNEDRFEESSNGKPLYNGKIAIKKMNIGEIGFSYMGGVYNKFENDGIVIDKQRWLHVFAIDINTKINKTKTNIIGEFVVNWIDVPETYTQQYGNKQRGAFLDIVQPILQKEILDWRNATDVFGKKTHNMVLASSMKEQCNDRSDPQRLWGQGQTQKGKEQDIKIIYVQVQLIYCPKYIFVLAFNWSGA